MNTMLGSVLFMLGLGPEPKLVLLKLLEVLHQELIPMPPVSELSLRVGMDEASFSRGLKYLLKEGFLLDEVLHVDGNGGSVKSIRLSSKVYKQLAERPTPAHQRAISHLLYGGKNPGELGLSVSEFLALNILLFESDRAGVVSNVSYLDVAKLLCVKKTTAKSCLAQLTQLGFVRRSVPGYKGVGFFGTQKSVHFLNLSHPVYGHNVPPSVVAVDYGAWSSVVLGSSPPGEPDFCRLPMHISSHRDIATIAHYQSLLRSKGMRPVRAGTAPRGYQELHDQTGLPWNRFSLIESFFGAEAFQKAVPVLQAKIDGYAAQLLSEHWDAVACNNPSKRQLMLTVLEDIPAVSKSARNSTSSSNRRALFEVARFLSRAAWSSARRAYFVLSRHRSDADFWKGCSFCFLPSELRAGGFSIGNLSSKGLGEPDSSSRRSSLSKRLCHVIIGVRDAQDVNGSDCFVTDHLASQDMKKIKTEQDLLLSESVRFGLLSINAKGLEDQCLSTEIMPRLRKNAPMKK